MLLSAYHVAMTLADPALRLMLRRRLARRKELADRLPERRGIDATPRPDGTLIWIHAASVGEMVSVLPVLRCLAARATVLMTTGTLTSARLLAERLAAMGLEGHVLHRFVPLDVPAWAARFLDHWRPDAAAFVESELWPNLLAAAVARLIPMLLVNARLSARSASTWARAPGVARQVLGAFTRVEAQTEADAARFSALGARDVSSPGNLKFAADMLPADEAELARLRAIVGARPAWLAASTHPGDDATCAEAHSLLLQRRPDALTIVAPRHPDRGAALSALFGDAPRRSLGEDPSGPVWIADTLGELGLLYRLAPIVVMGKSFGAPGGGQNPLEPARLGCAIASGPHMANFADAADVLARAGGLATVPDAASLEAWVERMWADPAAREAASSAAASVADAHADLPQRIAATLLAMAA